MSGNDLGNVPLHNEGDNRIRNDVPLYWIIILAIVALFDSVLDFAHMVNGWVILFCNRWLGFNCWLQKRAISLVKLILSDNFSWLGNDMNECLFVSKLVTDLDSFRCRLVNSDGPLSGSLKMFDTISGQFNCNCCCCCWWCWSLVGRTFAHWWRSLFWNWKKSKDDVWDHWSKKSLCVWMRERECDCIRSEKWSQQRADIH